MACVSITWLSQSLYQASLIFAWQPGYIPLSARSRSHHLTSSKSLPPPCSLVLHRVLWSSIPSELPLTIVTTVTPSRLDALEAQCGSWAGPLAAAVYVPLTSVAVPLVPRLLASEAAPKTGWQGPKEKGVMDKKLAGPEATRIAEVDKALQGLFDRSGRGRLFIITCVWELY